MVTLYLIGLGLSDEKDISLKGLEAIQKSKRVFLESYTSILTVPKERLESFYKKQIEIAYWETCENEIDNILAEISKSEDQKEIYSFLVVGDPFCATTHSDLFLRAQKRGLLVKVIHNASIMNAIGITGLQVYCFGPSVSVCFFTELWKPDSFLFKFLKNYEQGLHTLLLLDIKVKEISEENIIKGRKVYEPPRFMTINQAIEQIFEVYKNNSSLINNIRLLRAYGLAWVGADDQQIVSGTLEDLISVDFGKPLHSLVIPGPNLHHTELEMFQHYNLTSNKLK